MPRVDLRAPVERVLDLRVPVLRPLVAPRVLVEPPDAVPADFFLPPVFDPLVLRVDERVPLEADFADRDPADFARVPLERVPPDFAREPVERVPVDLRAPLPRDEEPPLDAPPSSSVHLPDMTRCAASATASAISEPSLVALDITLLAAADAVSAASSPASRIARRAFGLALIAAAAAARPAASISLLIAAFVILSTVVSPDDLDEPVLDDLEVFRADFAIANLPLSRDRHFKAVTVP